MTPSTSSSVLARAAAMAITGVAKALTGARSVWLGCAPVPRQRIYYANHSSHSDFVLLWASLPPLLRQRTRPVAGADYWSKGLLRQFIIHRVFRGVLVDRSGSGKSGQDGVAAQQASAAAAAAAPEGDSSAEQASAPSRADALVPLRQALDAGDSLILFPEGTRNLHDELLPFKSGLYHLARAYPDVEIVPVWLGNLNRVMPKGAWIPLPLLCTVSFGAPIAVQDGEDKAAFLARARQALIDLSQAVEVQA
ncbi:lysophospholipid acyltransferase family protein [Lampropedia cohaerens]|nr:lysophospholipid acyltransferase family protein [Lampropedia cohaerens]